MSRQIRFLTQTAAMLALLIGVQFITRPLGQLVTGALVNLILLVSTFLIGTASGLVIAVVSPFLAFILGIGPAFIQILPFIAAGNGILVIIAQFFRGAMGLKSKKEISRAAAGLIAASAGKTAFLWVGLVLIALPLIPGIKEKQITAISAAFTWPQLITALLGSMLTMILLPVLKKALAKMTVSSEI